MTKLKFEGKTFHIYANQKEVRTLIMPTLVKSKIITTYQIVL